MRSGNVKWFQIIFFIIYSRRQKGVGHVKKIKGKLIRDKKKRCIIVYGYLLSISEIFIAGWYKWSISIVLLPAVGNEETHVYLILVNSKKQKQFEKEIPNSQTPPYCCCVNRVKRLLKWNKENYYSWLIVLTNLQIQ